MGEERSETQLLTNAAVDSCDKGVDWKLALEEVASCQELLKDWGLLAGFINGASPLPNIPLILVAAALEPSLWSVALLLLLMHLGRFCVGPV